MFEELIKEYHDGRIPGDISSKLSDYLKGVRSKSVEQNKKHYFSSVILQGWFEIPPELIDIEEKRNDLWIAGIITETKKELNKTTREDAIEKCIRYREVREKSGQPVERAIITDGIIFEIYEYTNGTMNQIDKFDLSQSTLTPRECYQKLYRAYFPPEDILLPLEEQIVYARLMTRFKPFIEQIEEEIDAREVKFRLWKRYLATVFGQDTDTEALKPLYARQTYLYMLAVAVSASVLEIDTSSHKSILDGSAFYDKEIINFVNKDNFFNWLPDALTEKLFSAITEELDNFDFTERSGDFFRLLYESMVTPETRHDLGEFYTPPWLATILIDEMTTERLCDRECTLNELDEIFLDPTCGSGTFLKLLVEERAKENVDIERITNQVIGFDINPIAIPIAKANYILALSEALEDKEHGWIKIPVFLADSLLPDYDESTYDRSALIDGRRFKSVRIPFDEILTYAKPQLFRYPEDSTLQEVDRIVDNVMEQAEHDISPKDDDPNKDLIETMSTIMKKGDNHVWSYVIQNIYTPEYFIGKVDLIIGNPPWLTYKDIKLPNRQKFIDTLYTKYNMSAGSHHKTQQDLGAFFIARCQEYFNNETRIGFVFTRSIFNGGQYDPVRRGSWHGPYIQEIYDFDQSDNIDPFRKPSCICIFGDEYNNEIDCKIIGPDETLRPEKRYINLTANESGIAREKIIRATNESPYKEPFRNGATIHPRSYFFVDVQTSGKDMAKVSTLERYGKNTNKRHRKKDWAVLENERVPKQYIYEAVLGESLERYRLESTFKVLLPIEPISSNYEMIYTAEADSERYKIKETGQSRLDVKHRKVKKRLRKNMRELYQRLEEDWERIRGSKFDIDGKSSHTMSILDNMNYQNKLLKQRPNYDWVVIYNESGSKIRAVATNKPNLIIEHKAYYYYPRSEEEAHYLVAFLNSRWLENALEELGILSERSIGKKPFEIPLPMHDDSNPNHKRLAELGKDPERDEDEIDELISEIIEAQ